MTNTMNEPERSQSRPPTASQELRAKKWAKYDAMMVSVIAACERHLAIIRAEQIRADEELIAAARNGRGAK